MSVITPAQIFPLSLYNAISYLCLNISFFPASMHLDISFILFVVTTLEINSYELPKSYK